MRELYVDGHSLAEGVFVGTDAEEVAAGKVVAPFVVFDADAQRNIAGPFDTYGEAALTIRLILAGAKPKLDEEKLRQRLDRLDTR